MSAVALLSRVMISELSQLLGVVVVGVALARVRLGVEVLVRVVLGVA